MTGRDTRTAEAFASSWNTVREGSVYSREQFLDWIAPIAPESVAGLSVLELGYGNGSLLAHMGALAPRRLAGIELGDTLETTRRNLAHLDSGLLDLHRGDLVAADLGTFDLVYCIGVLHHLQDPEAGIRSLLRHTRPGGRFHGWVYAREGNGIVRLVVEPILETVDLDSSDFRLLVNPTGRFEIGGPMGDAGLTGRKIIVDTYGGMARHGGGAFSGKDPSKVDRSAAYAGRYVAKNIVAAGLASRCQIQISYAIGVSKPTSVMVETYGTGKVSDEQITELVLQHFDLRPKGIVNMLDLLRPIYKKTAAYGHFGREEPEFTWEKTDKAEALRFDAGL